jgi:cytochrome c biogenesis protein CcmG/thiol:disulfide interchange protein DsbE
MKFIYWTLIVCVVLWGAAFSYLTQLQQNSIDSKDTAIDRYKESSEIGYMAPSFELIGMDENNYSLASLNGKPVVINFWASWCEPCKEEAPELVRLYNEYKEKLEIYAVNLTKNDRVKDVQDFVETYHLNFPVLLDSEGEIAKKYNVLAIPTTFFIDSDGRIVDQIIGIADKKTLEKKFGMLAFNEE